MSDPKTPLVKTGAEALAEENLPPVVARLVVEIRSDGTKTIARGAIEDHLTGEKAAIRLEGQSPAALARALGKSLLTTPFFARETLLSLLPSGVLKRLKR